MPWPIRPPPITPIFFSRMTASMTKIGNCRDPRTLRTRGIIFGRSAEENGHACSFVGRLLVLDDGFGGLPGGAAAGARKGTRSPQLAGGVAAVDIHHLPGAEVRRRRQ